MSMDPTGISNKLGYGPKPFNPLQETTGKNIPPSMGQSTLIDTLTERGTRYGSFTGHAKVTQDLKRILALHLADREKTLADDQQEALDMICHKIGRIINGDPDYDDSWRDIAGYAQLVCDRLNGINR